MKNLFKLFVPVAAAAIALVSCQPKEEQVGNNPAGEITIRVHASADDLKAGDQETKTYIDENKAIIWGTGEYMKLALTAGETTTFVNSTDASADIFDGDSEAMFEFSVTPGEANEYVYQGLYPASAAATTTNTNAANYKVNLPAIQNATASSYDPAAYIMVAKPESFTSVQDDWEASFRRGTALNKITLKNFASSVEINKVKITAEGKKLAGGRHFNLTTGEGLEVYDTDATIEVLYATPLTGTSMDVWFTSWNADLTEGDKLTVVAYTTDNKTYTKEITLASGQTIKFKEGYLNTLGAKFDGISPETIASLDGDYVILAKHNTSYYALKGEASTTRIASVDYTGSTTSFEGDASLVWTIATSGNGYTIKNGSNFIGWTSESGNAADLVDENDYDATKCLMVIEEDGDVYHIKVSADQSRVLAKNTGAAYFAFYASTGQYSDIVLVPATALEVVATPTFNPAAGEVTSGTEVTISSATDGATIYYTTDGTDPTTSSTQGTSVTITATTTIKAIAVKSGMANSEIATAQYTIAGATDYSVIETSNVTLTAGTNGSAATVNGEEAIKVGTSSKGGDMTVTVPAGTTKLHLHAAAWNGVNGLSLNISGATVSPSSIALTADSGIANNSPFTLAGNPADFYFVLELSDITADTDITFTSSIAKRFVVWGVNAEAGPSITWDLESISISNPPTKTTYTAGQSFDPAGMVVTGHFVDADDNTNTKDEEVTGYTFTPDGALATTDTQVTITYQGKTATQNITVNAAPAGNDGTLEHPYTASEARALALNGDTGSYYISGIVTKIQNQYSASYGTANFWIDENGTDQTVFEGYKIKYFGNVNWVEGNAEIALNDEVIIYGTLTVYNTTTAETSSGYLVSLNGKTKGLTLAAPTVSTNDSAKQITVAWTAATGTESSIGYVINCGTQSYNATAAGNHTFTMTDYGTYSVSVEATASDAVSAARSTTATLTDPNAASTTTEPITSGTFSFANSKLTLTLSSGVTIEQSKVSGSTAVNSNYNTVSTLRVYKGHALTFTGKTFTRIEIKVNGSNYGNTLTANTGTLTPTTTSGGTIVWEGESDSVVITNNATTTNTQLRTTSFTVTYK